MSGNSLYRSTELIYSETGFFRKFNPRIIILSLPPLCTVAPNLYEFSKNIMTSLFNMMHMNEGKLAVKILKGHKMAS